MTMTTTNEYVIAGGEAIELAELLGLRIDKYEDPTEAAREGLSLEEARRVATEDPGLLYVRVSPSMSIGEGDDCIYYTRAEDGQWRWEPACGAGAESDGHDLLLEAAREAQDWLCGGPEDPCDAALALWRTHG